MSDHPLLAVRGDAVVEVDAEIARLGVTVAAQDPDRAKTLRLLDERAVAVDAVLARFDDAVEKVETSGVRVAPKLAEGKAKERVSGYVAVVSHTVTVVDFALLGQLVAQLADVDLTEVAGPWWALRPHSPAHRRARVEAVQDAVQCARDYAQALGSQVTELVELADARLLSEGRGEPMVLAAASGPMRARHAGAPEELGFDLSPARQVVRATVEARFRITAPSSATLQAR